MALVVLIVGERNSGKSSLIRGLTSYHGKGNFRDDYLIENSKGKILKVLFSIDSFQEKVPFLTGDKLNAIDLVHFIKSKKNVDIFLFTSRYRSNRGYNNSCLSIIEEFEKRSINYLIVEIGDKLKNTGRILRLNPNDVPNKRAYLVRNHLLLK